MHSVENAPGAGSPAGRKSYLLGAIEIYTTTSDSDPTSASLIGWACLPKQLSQIDCVNRLPHAAAFVRAVALCPCLVTVGEELEEKLRGLAVEGSAYSGQSVHSFRLKPSSDSGRNRPAVPGQAVQSSGP